MISLSKIAHQMWYIQSPIQPKKQDNRMSSGGWGLEATGKGGWKKSEKRGGCCKIMGLGPPPNYG